MRNIIPIQKQTIGSEEVNSVDARVLHEELGIKKDFSNWIKTQISSLMLEENIDYIVFAQKGENLSLKVKNPLGGRPSQEYIVSLETAKHISMASRTAKGKEVREYFIKAEKELKGYQNQIPHSRIETISHTYSEENNNSALLLAKEEAYTSKAELFEAKMELERVKSEFEMTKLKSKIKELEQEMLRREVHYVEEKTFLQNKIDVIEQEKQQYQNETMNLTKDFQALEEEKQQLKSWSKTLQTKVEELQSEITKLKAPKNGFVALPTKKTSTKITQSLSKNNIEISNIEAAMKQYVVTDKTLAMISTEFHILKPDISTIFGFFGVKDKYSRPILTKQRFASFEKMLSIPVQTRVKKAISNLANGKELSFVLAQNLIPSQVKSAITLSKKKSKDTKKRETK